ncbi:hypothetical protein, partial [Frankia sp. Cj3]|uniref:hypothetical protein n=1 Tax=Frankia sp. Cj3 TaxID=2880976 RepID=UPI001EF4F5D6
LWPPVRERARGATVRCGRGVSLFPAESCRGRRIDAVGPADQLTKVGSAEVTVSRRRGLVSIPSLQWPRWVRTFPCWEPILAVRRRCFFSLCGGGSRDPSPLRWDPVRRRTDASLASTGTVGLLRSMVG